METRAMAIARLNDGLRTQQPACLTITSGVRDSVDVLSAIEMVQDYDDFNPNNDPYGEHDFGRFELEGEVLFWKIDYYDQDHKVYCDPLDEGCRRVLTVMLAEEY